LQPLPEDAQDEELVQRFIDLIPGARLVSRKPLQEELFDDPPMDG